MRAFLATILIHKSSVSCLCRCVLHLSLQTAHLAHVEEVRDLSLVLDGFTRTAFSNQGRNPMTDLQTEHCDAGALFPPFSEPKLGWA